MNFSQADLTALRAVWAQDVDTKIVASRALPRDREEVLGVIAKVEIAGTQVSPCAELRLQNIEEIKARRVRFTSGHTFSSRTYFEQWNVDACGRSHRWFVFDNLADGELQVVLVGDEPPASPSPDP